MYLVFSRGAYYCPLIQTLYFFYIYLLRPFEICENANLVNAISIQSYEESFRSGALLHYPSKHPVSSQLPENGEKWGKGYKPSSKRKRNCKSYFRIVIVALNSALYAS